MSVLNLKKASETNWKRIDEMYDDAIDTSDIPELDESFFASAKLVVPKDQMTVRMKVGDDEDEEDDADEGQSLSFFDYLSTPSGHEVAKDVVKLFADFKNAVLDKTLQEKQHLLQYQQRVRTVMWVVQIVAFVIA